LRSSRTRCSATQYGFRDGAAQMRASHPVSCHATRIVRCLTPTFSLVNSDRAAVRTLPRNTRWLLAVDRPAAAEAAELPASPDELLTRAATRTIAHPDLPEGVFVHLALGDAVRRNIEGGAVARRDC